MADLSLNLERMSLDRALALADHASPSPHDAHLALLSLREYILIATMTARSTSGDIHKALATIVQLGAVTNPSGEAIPREPVMDQVMAIRRALDRHSTSLPLNAIRAFASDDLLPGVADRVLYVGLDARTTEAWMAAQEARVPSVGDPS